jgi:hypothetical protein
LLSRERLERRKRRRGEQAAPSLKRKEKKRSHHLSSLFLKHAEPPREKEDKGKLEISLAHSPLFCISFF